MTAAEAEYVASRLTRRWRGRKPTNMILQQAARPIDDWVTGNVERLAVVINSTSGRIEEVIVDEPPIGLVPTVKGL